MALSILFAVAAQAQTAKIVGHGASTCADFNQEIQGNPALEREFFAWAQGFMSGALMRAPQGVDEDIDLLPDALPAAEQMKFVQEMCLRNTGQDYMDAVRALYHQLRDLRK
ncbi:hypothetical protein [Methylobacterium durans]|uniref:hypothetical protein n=1 Tax=Methylobacterium durans TaxID=2202825 RepID=UPI001F312DA7|nr:hypothetical protein [Methylobacterium durans]